MITRIVIPVENKDGLNAPIAQHFGRAPFFAVVDLDEAGNMVAVETQANTGEHYGGTGHPHETLLALKPSVIVAYGMGPGGLASFGNAGVQVLKAAGKTVKEVITQFKVGKLERLTVGCGHAHHHHH
ncbi:MAG: NifB/NifX family molybdenum-iron cluster-binding protein [Candidatus Bathyarchaeia archaeon]